MPPIFIELNGERTAVTPGETVSSLLESLRRDARAVAIEHNGEILPRDRYAKVTLTGDDRIEIVAFVQGG